MIQVSPIFYNTNTSYQYIRTDDYDDRTSIELTSAITSDRAGLHNNNHLLGVIPLVLFWNLSGVIS